ncbi:hypothetical protein LTR04_003491, partial [Oleoguttula sp. CCFEE 6159]
MDEQESTQACRTPKDASNVPSPQNNTANADSLHVPKRVAPPGIVPPLGFSSSKGSLHKRRASRSISRSPPKSHVESFPPFPHKHQRLNDGNDQDQHRPPTPTSPTATLARLSLSSAAILPEPTTTATVTPRNASFSLFSAFLAHSELILVLSRHLTVDALVALYAISKPFHYLLNSHYTTYILASARAHSQDAEAIFPFKAYGPLCIVDPAHRPNAERPGEVRKVPSFRWLRMVVFRERVVSDIIALLAQQGHRLPVSTARAALKKCWFLVDIPTNAGRIGLLHNTAYFTAADLFGLTMLFLKLDMRFTDPVDGAGGERRLRNFLLAERSLSALHAVLAGGALTSSLQMLRLFVRHAYRPPAAHTAARLSILGVPANEVGRAGFEGWGLGRERLLRPDELVMREG